MSSGLLQVEFFNGTLLLKFGSIRLNGLVCKFLKKDERNKIERTGLDMDKEFLVL